MAKNNTADIKVPPSHDWRTTDTDEINKRRLRAREESFAIANLEPQHAIFSNFRVQSGSGLSYSVEIRDVDARQFACDCVGFRINGLGTCKHVEAVLLHLESRFRRLFAAALSMAHHSGRQLPLFSQLATTSAPFTSAASNANESHRSTFTPRGASICDRTVPSARRSCRTLMTPCGVGYVPSAHCNRPSRGAMRTRLKPGSNGSIPSTC